MHRKCLKIKQFFNIHNKNFKFVKLYTLFSSHVQNIYRIRITNDFPITSFFVPTHNPLLQFNIYYIYFNHIIKILFQFLVDKIIQNLILVQLNLVLYVLKTKQDNFIINYQTLYRIIYIFKIMYFHLINIKIY